LIKPREDVALMEGYHSPQVDVKVRLNTNESPEPPPPAWQREWFAALSAVDWHRYPDRAATHLRTAIADLHRVDPARVFVANGSNEVLQTVLLTYGGHGRTAAVWVPTYALHAHIARLTGTEVVEGGRGPDLATDLDEVRRVYRQHRPHVAFLCSPNNPTGLIDDEASVVETLALAREVDGLLVVDEAYGQFAPWSAVDLVDAEVPLVVTRTFSKTWSMAGTRLGYLIGPAQVVAELDKVVLPYHLDAGKQLAGIVALDHVEEMNARVAHLVEERGRLQARLGELAVEVWPSAANFILFRPRALDGHQVWQALVDRSILVRDFSGMPHLTGCLRVTVGTTDEDDAFLDALTEILT
jgi:histidinol-phosphate aminotransferase